MFPSFQQAWGSSLGAALVPSGSQQGENSLISFFQKHMVHSAAGVDCETKGPLSHSCQLLKYFSIVVQAEHLHQGHLGCGQPLVIVQYGFKVSNHCQ